MTHYYFPVTSINVNPGGGIIDLHKRNNFEKAKHHE